MATGSRMLAAVMILAKPVLKAVRCQQALPVLATPIRAASLRTVAHHDQPSMFLRKAWGMRLRTFASASAAAQAGASVYVGNLPYSTTELDLRDWFGEIGEVAGIRIGVDQNGRARGFAHIDFVDPASAAKAVSYDGEQMNGRTLRIDHSTPRAPRNERAPMEADGLTCFVKGFATHSAESARAALTEAFSPYGEVKDVILPVNRDTGMLKGFGYVVFSEANGANVRAAEALQGANAAGGRLTTDPNATSQKRAPANRAPAADSDGKTLFVKGFDPFLGEDAVRGALTDLFSEFGDVVEVRLPMDRVNNCLKGFGYVTFAEADGTVARATESLTGAECAGGSLFIDPNPRPPRVNTPRGSSGSYERRGGYGGRNDRGGSYY